MTESKSKITEKFVNIPLFGDSRQQTWNVWSFTNTQKSVLHMMKVSINCAKLTVEVSVIEAAAVVDEVLWRALSTCSLLGKTEQCPEWWAASSRTGIQEGQMIKED